MKIREIEGSQEEIIAYLKWHEGREDLMATIDDFESIHLPDKPATPPKIKDLMEWDANMPDETRLPSEGRSSNLGHPTNPSDELRQLVYALWDQGHRGESISKILAEEHDVSKTASQITGMISQRGRSGRRNVKQGSQIGTETSQMTREASKSGEETSLRAPSEDAAKEPTTKPKSKELALEIKRLYNKEHLRTIQIAEKMQISVEQVEAIVWQVKG